MHVARHRRRHLLRHPRRRLGRQGRQAGRGQRPRLQPQGGAGTAQDGGPDAQPQGDRLHRRPLHRQGVRVQGLRRQEAHPPLARRGHLHRQGAPAPSDAAQAGLARRAHVHLRLDGRPEGRDDPAEAAPCPDGRPCPRHARGGAGPVRQPRHAHRLLAAGPHLRARHRVRLLRLGARGWLRGPEDASARAREVQADRLARGVPADAHGGRAQGVGGDQGRRSREGEQGGPDCSLPGRARSQDEGTGDQAVPVHAPVQPAAQEVQADDGRAAAALRLGRRRNLGRGTGVGPDCARRAARAGLRPHRDDGRDDGPKVQRPVDRHRRHADGDDGGDAPF
mmetsp:Transcript_31577/g.93802  ORF Transcript_31577/g.93802 Transcript_31577/m.93802 type:complete len:336 (+) Transcript_31577:568-1575(+)